MTLVNFLDFLEPIQNHFTRLYSTASEIIVVLLILWVLNFVAGLVQKTFSIGKACGGFYRAYLHRHFKAALLWFLGLFNRLDRTAEKAS